MAWIVMAGVEMTSANSNRETCFELNAIDIPTEAKAKRIAAERNEVERRAGHTNVLWFPCPDMSEMLAQMRR